MKAVYRTLLALLVPLSLLIASDTPSTTDESAWQSYQEGNYQQAAKQYQSLQAQKQSPSTAYNYGNALYKAEKYAEAEAQFLESIRSQDLSLQALSYHNLGNTYYQQGRLQLSQDPQKTLELWQQSAEQFGNALALDENLSDSAENQEILQDLIKQLEEQLQQQEQQQQEQQQQQENEEQNENEEQEQEQEQSENGEQDPQEQSQDSGEQEKQEGEQGDPQEDGEPSNDSPGDDSESSPQNGEEPSQNSEDGGNAEEQNTDPQEEGTPQSEEELKESMKQQQEQAANTAEPDSASDKEKNSNPNFVQGYLTQAEAEKILQSIGEKEQKLSVQQASQSSKPPPEPGKFKNW